MYSVGTRCDLCTGCGRCFSGNEDLQIITGNKLNENFQKEKRSYADDEMICSNSCKKIIAADIGTTTVAMVLYDAAGREEDRFATVNPQVEYGADVLSRIQAARNPQSARKMQKQVLDVLAEGVRRFRRKQEEMQSYLVIGANTAMVYLLCGFDPEELGHAPFAASHLAAVPITVEGVEGIILPGISAFVGSDVLAGIYACGMTQRQEITLFIDLGTNGEMALGNCEGVTAGSAAAGPAFEGGASRGIWGADMVHLTARLLREGILDETGLMSETYFERGVRIGDVLVTQKSIRELQLAKAAVAAGIRLLAESYGLESLEQVDRVVLAGGFGYYLRAEDAVRIGLLPEVLEKKVISAGNTVLAGLCKYGLFCDFCSENCGMSTGEAYGKLQEIAGLVKVINLAEQENFAESYLEAMYLRGW